MNELRDIAAKLDWVGFHAGSRGNEEVQVMISRSTERLRELAGPVCAKCKGSGYKEADPKAASTKKIKAWAPTARVLVPCRHRSR